MEKTNNWKEKFLELIFETENVEVTELFDSAYEAVLNELGHKMGNVLDLRIRKNMTYREIAAELDITYHRTQTLFHRAIGEIKHNKMTKYFTEGYDYVYAKHTVSSELEANKSELEWLAVIKHKLKEVDALKKMELDNLNIPVEVKENLANKNYHLVEDLMNINVVKLLEALFNQKIDSSNIPRAEYKIKDLDLKPDLKKILCWSNISTLEDLSNMTRSEMLELYGMGKKRIKEIELVLSAHGMKFKED